MEAVTGCGIVSVVLSFSSHDFRAKCPAFWKGWGFDMAAPGAGTPSNSPL
jgi:hypothetical protein